jgi:hypothetical protein
VATSILTAGRARLDSSIYPQDCVAAAATAYSEFLRIESTAGETGAVELDIRVRPGFELRAVQLRREFLNYLLDLSIQHYLAR